ncbi:hypothetical protein CAF53_02470 [Sphingobium sp. LB126]|uniref:hypothetical protein n=1 Tax=Sphingobium sp. LB126 TaxID=1983755 RepID=UPI000C20EB45|nr:hypothetical protein [Sphingobium sp. LB126]PJG47230.1 hypothetical protein CAF53_02470 [Sphingobium sp. LB126]
MHKLSPLRARLASFEHAYALAWQLRRSTGRNQFIVRTGNPLQPVRVVDRPPSDGAIVMALL